jgi:hypothetical protein
MAINSSSRARFRKSRRVEPDQRVRALLSGRGDELQNELYKVLDVSLHMRVRLFCTTARLALNAVQHVPLDERLSQSPTEEMTGTPVKPPAAAAVATPGDGDGRHLSNAGRDVRDWSPSAESANSAEQAQGDLARVDHIAENAFSKEKPRLAA